MENRRRWDRKKEEGKRGQKETESEEKKKPLENQVGKLIERGGSKVFFPIS